MYYIGADFRGLSRTFANSPRTGIYLDADFRELARTGVYLAANRCTFTCKLSLKFSHLCWPLSASVSPILTDTMSISVGLSGLCRSVGLSVCRSLSISVGSLSGLSGVCRVLSSVYQVSVECLSSRVSVESFVERKSSTVTVAVTQSYCH